MRVEYDTLAGQPGELKIDFMRIMNSSYDINTIAIKFYVFIYVTNCDHRCSDRHYLRPY